MRGRYCKSGNPVKSYKHLSVYYMMSMGRVLNFTMKLAAGTIK